MLKLTHLLRRLIVFLLALPMLYQGCAQYNNFDNHKITKADELRGALRPERTCFDVNFYNLDIKVDIEKKQIDGFVDIYYTAITDFDKIQVDLFANLKIDKIIQDGNLLTFNRKYDAVFITTLHQQKDTRGVIRIYYHGTPRQAKNPPWDGGFVWSKDDNGNPWIGVACEGIGASLWWPNKDHLSDEPDSMSIKVSIPDDLVCVSNGDLRETEQLNNGFTRWDWFVSYPINNYNVTVNIAKYKHFSDLYVPRDGKDIRLDYYVLPYHLDKAKQHFRQVRKVLDCFEYYFDVYPFRNDGYALVETPYLGMEHQSAIAYGNRYMSGYLGGRIPGDMDWDFIIVHETAHEWWGNSISAGDAAETWIHEGFATYMEALFIEYNYNYERSLEYLASLKRRISNSEPIIGPMQVNWIYSSTGDEYYKGAWMLHTLRSAIGDDKTWFALIKSFYNKYKYSVITTDDFVHFVNDFTKRDYTAFFDQYLRHAALPVFSYSLSETKKGVSMSYRWKTDVKNFDMPIRIEVKDTYRTISPVEKEQEIFFKDVQSKDIRISTGLFLVDTEKY